MSNPHGSKPIELIRFLANKLMSDSQRKKTKNFLYRLQRLPIRMLGIENLIDSQKAEIERLKSMKVFDINHIMLIFEAKTRPILGNVETRQSQPQFEEQLGYSRWSRFL